MSTLRHVTLAPLCAALIVALPAQPTPPSVLATGGGAGPAMELAIAYDPIHDETLVVSSRPGPHGHHDLDARLFSADRTTNWPVFADVDPTQRSTAPTATFTAGRFVVAWQREDGTSDSTIRVHFHDGGDHTFASGVSLDVPDLADAEDRHPSLGGTTGASAAQALLTFRRDAALGPDDSDSSRVLFARIDVNHRSLGAASDLSSGHPAADSQAASVCDGELASMGWVVAWQESDRLATPPLDWNLYARRIGVDGQLGPIVRLGNSDVPSEHGLRPLVAGRDGRYLLAYLVQDVAHPGPLDQGRAVAVQRLIWHRGAWLPSAPFHEVLATASPGTTLSLGTTSRNLAFDHESASHWALTWLESGVGLNTARIGGDARSIGRALTARTTASSTPSTAGAACLEHDNALSLVFPLADTRADDPIVEITWPRPPAAIQRFGIGCAGRIDTGGTTIPDLPFAGSDRFELWLRGGRPLAPTWFAVTPTATDQGLPAGPGCRLLLDTSHSPVVIGLRGGTDPSGDRRLRLPLPASLQGVDLAWQALQLDGGRTWSSDGLMVRIR